MFVRLSPGRLFAVIVMFLPIVGCDGGSVRDPDGGGGDAADGAQDASDPGRDAGSDAGEDAGEQDAGVDAGTDAGADAGTDAGADGDGDAGSDSPACIIVEAQDIAVSIDMGLVARVALSDHVAVSPESQAVTFSVASHDGSGQARIEGNELRYASAIEPGPILVETIAHCGDDLKEFQVAITLENQVTLDEAKAAIIEGYPALRNSLDAWSGSTLYFGSYVNLTLRNAFAATCDVEFWNLWKDYFELAQSKATQTYVRVESGEFFHPDNEGNTFSGPYIDFGAQYQSYVNFPPYLVSGIPNAKGQMQWCMTALHMVYDVVTEKCPNLPPAEIDYAVMAYDWMHRNIVEFLATERNGGWTGSRWYRMMMHARDVTQSDPPGQSGYWGSNVGVGMTMFMLEDAIRIELGRDKYPYMQWVDNIGATAGDVWTTIDWNPATWYSWWKSNVQLFPDGTGLWDCGDDPGDPAYNPYINTTGGWGYPGEHKCPGTSHASRYIYLAQVALDTGADGDLTVMNAISKTFGQMTCLPLDYQWTSGTQAGLSSGTQRTANYIDGDNTCFRCPESGWYTPSGSNEDMEGFIYQGWYLGGVLDDDAKDCVTRIFHDISLHPWRPDDDPETPGTYMRHRSPYGRPALWSNMLDIDQRRRSP